MQECEVICTNKDWPEGTAFQKMFLETFHRSPLEMLRSGFVVKLGRNFWNGRDYSTVLCWEEDPSFVVPEWARDYYHNEWQSDPVVKANYIAGRMENDPRFRIGNEIRRAAWRSYVLGEDDVELLGCDSATLRRHLEKQFKDGMNHKNYATLWEIDHSTAITRFNVLDPEGKQAAAHYLNLAPMKVEENRKKYNLPAAA